MDLTNEDVADILALLDSLPYDELDLRTSRFRLTLRRAPAGWTQERQLTADPDVADASADGTGPSADDDRPDDGTSKGAAPYGSKGNAPNGGRPRAAQRAPASEHRRGPGEPGGPERSEGTSTAQPGGTASTGAGPGGSKGGEAPLGSTAPLGNTAPLGSATLIDVTTPLPGTFYRAPRPGAAPFAEVGTVVEPDTVVAVVETMKLMNPVHAGTRGRVAEILVANAGPVAQGAVLLRIEPGRPE